SEENTGDNSIDAARPRDGDIILDENGVESVGLCDRVKRGVVEQRRATVARHKLIAGSAEEVINVALRDAADLEAGGVGGGDCVARRVARDE
ncbi:MAG: hypothetical protein PHI35_00640, partial [Victivallaceae bacterium]|nr:hypothetical protein [Victivallaceae bacterium]